MNVFSMLMPETSVTFEQQKTMKCMGFPRSKKKKSIADGTQLACMTIMSAGLHHPERKPSPIHLNHVRYK